MFKRTFFAISLRYLINLAHTAFLVKNLLFTVVAQAWVISRLWRKDVFVKFIAAFAPRTLPLTIGV